MKRDTRWKRSRLDYIDAYGYPRNTGRRRTPFWSRRDKQRIRKIILIERRVMQEIFSNILEKCAWSDEEVTLNTIQAKPQPTHWLHMANGSSITLTHTLPDQRFRSED